MPEVSKPVQLKAWWRAARPPFYIATLIPIFLGQAWAVKTQQHWNGVVLCGVLLICFILHLAANLANELFDHLQGADSEGSIGGTGVIASGEISIRDLKIVLAALYSLVLCFSGIGIWMTGLPALWGVIAVAVFSSFFYVAPPLKYGYRALGELSVFINMGLLMVEGTYYAISGEFSLELLAISIPVGLMVAGILYYQSLPEIETDKAVGKRTLANLLGPINALFLFRLWWLFVWLLMIMLWLCGLCSWFVLCGIVCSVPCYVKINHILNCFSGDWLSLDKHGRWVRMMYLICGLSLLAGLLL